MFFYYVLLLQILTIFIVTYGVATIRKRNDARLCEQHRELMEKLVKATRERREWLKEHSYLSNPHDDERYKGLWLTEIGAEILFNIATGCETENSYEEYQLEKALYDKE